MKAIIGTLAAVAAALFVARVLFLIVDAANHLKDKREE